MDSILTGGSRKSHVALARGMKAIKLKILNLQNVGVAISLHVTLFSGNMLALEDQRVWEPLS